MHREFQIQHRDVDAAAVARHILHTVTNRDVVLLRAAHEDTQTQNNVRAVNELLESHLATGCAPVFTLHTETFSRQH